MSRNKKLATAGGSIAVVAAAIAMTAGTYSYFSDEGGNAPVEAQAGTLTLEIDGMSKVGNLNVSNLAPGDSVTHTFTVRNTGSLPGRVSLKLNTTDGAEDILDDALIAHLSVNGVGLAYSDPFTSLTTPDRQPTPAGVLQPGESKTYRLTLRFPTSNPAHDNAYQGASTSFSATARLEQEPMPANQ